MKFMFNGADFISNTNVGLKFADFKVIKPYIGQLTTEIAPGPDFGPWTYELEKNSDVYYFIDNSNGNFDVKELIPFRMRNESHYYININDRVFESTPEVNDVIYDSYKEAKLDQLLNRQIQEEKLTKLANSIQAKQDETVIVDY